MQQMIRTYGKLLLELLILGLLMVLLFSTVVDEKGNRGILNIIGANLQTGETDYDTYADFDVYMEESRKEAPVIMYETSGTMSTGQVKLTDYIGAYNQAGERLPLKVISIRSSDGAELLDTYNPDTSEIEIMQPGIYIIELSAVDEINKRTTCQIRMPVNNWSDGGGI